MKITIDIRNIGKGRTGDEVVFFELVKNLALIDERNEYFLLLDSREKLEIKKIKSRLGIIKKQNFKIVELGSGNKFIWNALNVPKFCRKQKIDIYHTQYIIPIFMPKHTKIVTHIHDVSFRVHKELISWKDAFFLNFLIPYALGKADLILAVSQFTKDEIIKYYNTPSEKIEVIYNASSLKKVNDNWQEIKEKYNLPDKYILALGTMQPRKNIPFLIKAFGEVADKIPGISLVLVGGKAHNFDDLITQTIEKHPNIKNRIIFTGYVGEDDKFMIFEKAQLFVFPSLYEGFGVPILEAMDAGTRVLASDIPPHIEIGGESVIYANPTDIDRWKKMLYDCLVSGKIKKDVFAEGEKLRESFSWRKSAQKLLTLYEKLGQTK